MNKTLDMTITLIQISLFVIGEAVFSSEIILYEVRDPDKEGQNCICVTDETILRSLKTR